MGCSFGLNLLNGIIANCVFDRQIFLTVCDKIFKKVLKEELFLYKIC